MTTSTERFALFAITDTDGETTQVTLGMDGDWRQCVKLTCRAEMTFDHASAYLDPAAARAIARALDEAAGEAEAANLGAE